MRRSLKLVSVVGLGLFVAACGDGDATDAGGNGGGAGAAGSSGAGAGGSGATGGSATGGSGGAGAGGAGGAAVGGSSAGGTGGGAAGAAGSGTGGTSGAATGGTGGGAAGTRCIIQYDAPPVTADQACDDSTSCQRVAKTGLGSFDSNKRIGPGRLVLRFEADASGAPRPSGAVEVLHYYSEFNFKSGPAGLAVISIEGCVSTAAGSACTDTFTTDPATALAATPLNTGTLNGAGTMISWGACKYTGDQPATGGFGMTDAMTGTGAGCLNTWRNQITNLGSDGKPPCTGSFCGAVPVQQANSAWIQYLEGITLGANFATASMSTPAYVPVDEASTTTRFTIVGAINAAKSTCVVN